MKSNIWGPYAWTALHIVPLHLSVLKPSSDCEFAEAWLNALRSSLPCSECQQHFNWYLDSNPLPNRLTPKKLSQYICDLHNHVSASNGSDPWAIKNVYDLYGYNPVEPSKSQLVFWSRNWLIFVYLAIHSPQIEWSRFKEFIHITGSLLPWRTQTEKELWSKMMYVIPDTRSESFAWFEEFRMKWCQLWKQQNPDQVWPDSIANSPYLRRMRWILTSHKRNNQPATGTWISLP